MNSYIKVIGYRIFEDTKEKKWKTKQVFFDLPYNFETHQALFDTLEGFLSTIDPNEKYNLHYTLNHIPKDAKNKKVFHSYQIIPIDLDTIDKSKTEHYIKVVEEILQVNRTEMAVINSGNGLHFLIQLDKPIQSEEELNAIRPSYDLLCSKIEDKLKELNLIYETSIDGVPKKTNIDRGVFRVGTLRLPMTRNIKYSKSTGQSILDTEADFITRFMIPRSLESIGLSKNPEAIIDSFDPDKYWGKTDSEFIFDQCGALKKFKESKGNVTYHQWFSALSIVSRFNDIDGVIEAHRISKGHKDYSQDETQRLIDATLKEGGPHKCDTFRRHYDECATCPLKCTTPIQLRSKKHLKHEDKGFHIYSQGKWNPYFKEMLVKVNQDYNYKVKGNNRELWIYEEADNLWKMWDYNAFRSYISTLMDKKPGDLAKTTTKNELESQILDRNELPDNYFADMSDGKVNFQNGFLKINKDKFEFCQHTPESYKEGFLYCLPFSYDEAAEAPLFKQFVEDICLEREDLVCQLLEYVGYCLSNDEIWEHKAMILKGEGANGKSVLLEIIKAMIGKGAYSILSLKQLNDVESRAQLIGAIANISDETPKDSLFEAEEFKKLVSGGEFEYRILYKGKGMARNKAKFIFSSNHDLHITDKSSGVLRRLMIVPMEANFDPKLGPVTREPDPFIIDKLKAELPGIFNMCIKAYIKAKERKCFTVSQVSQETLDEASEGSNPVRAYLSETVNMTQYDEFKKYKISDPDRTKTVDYYMDEVRNNLPKDDFSREHLSWVPLTKIRADFQEWSDEKGYKAQYTEMTFGREFTRVLKAHIGARRAEMCKMTKKQGRRTVRGMMIAWEPWFGDEFDGDFD